MSAETYLTPIETAQYLRTSPSTLAKRRMTKDGPVFTRIGSAIRYRKSDLDSWMAERVATSTSDAA